MPHSKYGTPTNLKEVEEELDNRANSSYPEVAILAAHVLKAIERAREEGDGDDLEILAEGRAAAEELLNEARRLVNEVVPKQFKVVFLTPYCEWENVLAFNKNQAIESVGIPPEIDHGEAGSFIAVREDGEEEDD